MGSQLKFLLSFILGILVVSCTVPVPAASPNQVGSLGQSLPISAQVTIASQVIELEVARTSTEQSIGLMDRDRLPDNHGMLFPFSPPRPVGFWMKNVKISLDMVFLLSGRVVEIAINVPPCKAEPCPTYGPNGAVDQVIELRGNRASELGLKVGDRLTIQVHP